MEQIAESDWKVLRELRPVALERLCQRIIHGVRVVCGSDSKSYHERFVGAFAELQQGDDDVARTFDDLRRSNAIERIALMKAQGLIDDDELARFGDKTRGRVAVLLQVLMVRGKFSRNRILG